MKSLLVGIEATDPPGPWYSNLARAAGVLTRTFGSDVEVVGIEHPNFAAPVMLEGSWALLDEMRRQEVEAVGEVFQHYFTQAHHCPGARWSGVLKRDALGAQARLFDLTLLARPEGTQYGPSREPAENVLFHSGRPVLLVPDWEASIGTTIVISWIDTPESARAVQFAMPFLLRANRVHILAIKRGRISSDQSHGIAHNLELHGVRVGVKELPMGSSVATTTLDFTREAGADLLVKGAYTETRLQRFIFGDTTDYLVSNARLPLFLAH